MKKCLFSILIGLFGCNLPAQTADQDVAGGLAALTQQNLVSANQQFANALALSPTNASANALAAVTRLLLLPTTPAGSNFLTSLGYSTAGRNIYNWTSSLPMDANGDQLLPSVNTSAMIAFYRTNVMAALAASRTNLAQITDPAFTLSLTAAETSLQAVTLDYGDILLLQALERAAEFAGYTANAQNGDVLLSQLQALGKTNGLTIQRVLALYPSLLLLASPGDLAASKGAFTNAAALYFAASDFIRNVRAPAAPALFVLSDDETNDEAMFRTQLTNALASLNGPVAFSTANSNSITLNASSYFAGTKTLRSLLPQFAGDVYVPDTLPDYTFGGFLVDEPAYLVEKQLRHLFYSYAGIYNGVGGVSDNNGDYNGNFAVWVGTNQQATLVGFDAGDNTNDGSAFGLFAQFTVDKGGNWSFQTNNVSGFGSFDKSGDFNGELDYTNGTSVYLYAYLQSPLGPFQTPAGYYAGTFSGQASGALYLILAADGELFYTPVAAGNNPTGGGSPQLGSNDQFTDTEEPDGTLVHGTLNPSTFTITGTTTLNSVGGTFRVTRFANVPFDVPPAISRDLPMTVTAPERTNLTISVTVTGSPPLSYQWYADGIALPWATANTLVLSNLQFSSAGIYTVVIDNVVGETNSAFTLSVVCNSTPPTNQITAPTAGQHWSNALFTVTGKAGGKTAVTNVFYSLNQGGWSNAVSVNNWSNWSAQVTLVPGSNTLSAYALDTCGNVSATNAVTMVYVTSAALTADQEVTNGLAALAEQNLLSANQQFNYALALLPTNAAANALAAVTRLLLLPSTPAGSNFLNSLGYSTAGRNIYNWTSSLPVDTNGDQLLPSVNTSAMIAFYRTNVMAALAASRTNLARITDPTFTLSLTAAETSLQAVTLDYGDILLLQALERAAEFAGYTANAQNGDVVLSQLQALGKTNGLTIQRVLALYPSLLLLASPSDLAASKGAFTNAAALYFAASDFIRNVRPPGAPALFVLSGDETNDEAAFRTQLTNALASLNGPVAFSTANSNSITLNAGNYFAGTKTLRSLVPQFAGDVYVPDTLPDFTFGGILVDEPAYLTEEALRHLFYSYAGIYNGAGKLHDSNGNINGGTGGVGDYAVFVGTNQQATLVGTDYGDGTPDNYWSSLILQFSVDKDGNWQVVSNHDFSAYGQIGKDGSFSGEVDYSNGDSLFFSAADRQSPVGPFQTAAGYYRGTIKGGSETQLFAILAADGELNFLPASSSDTDIGASAQLDANAHFMTNLIDGTIYAGTLNPATQVINGTWTNGGNGTWTLTRAGNVPFDLPPAITRNVPTIVTAPVGTNLTVSLTATGSPPMCYQWYANGIAIPYATTNTLVLSNLLFTSAGIYSVAINNAGGQTNSPFTLAVICNSTPPADQITAPTAGQQWSNALFTVTGRVQASAGVSNVFYSLNQGGWSNAATVNYGSNWLAQVTLVPGPNTVAAYVMDTCGNVSATNQVTFTYVVSAPLTLQLVGKGAVSPNYSNALLQVGSPYTLTASNVAGSGFAFTNWTGGTSLPLTWLTNGATVTFTMVSNLVLQANFRETNRPMLTITAPTNGQHLTNALAYVTGTASDDWKITGVWYQLNSNAWTLAASTNGWTNWSTVLKLLAGTNTIRAFAADLGGNFSGTNSVSVLSSNTFKLWFSLTNNALPLSANGYAFNLQLSAGLAGHIQVSTNLADWTVLTNFVGTNPAVNFRDPAATNGQRFYRAVIP